MTSQTSALFLVALAPTEAGEVALGAMAEAALRSVVGCCFVLMGLSGRRTGILRGPRVTGSSVRLAWILDWVVV